MCVVLIIDEHGVYRTGLRSLIESRIRRSRVLEGRNFESAFAQIEPDQPLDLVMVDNSAMPEPEALRAAFDAHPTTCFALLSTSQTRAEILDCLTMGFHGFIPKLQDEDAILSAITDLLSGRIYVPRSVADSEPVALHQPRMPHPPTATPDIRRLTPRQQDVMTLLARGLSNKEIARELGISEATTKIHTAALLRALGARNRTEAAFKAAVVAGQPSTVDPRANQAD